MVVYRMDNKIAEYKELLRSFIMDEIDAISFEKKFFSLYKNDEIKWNNQVVSILFELFSDVDAYCSEPELRDDEDLDEIELKESVKRAFSKICNL